MRKRKSNMQNGDSSFSGWKKSHGIFLFILFSTLCLFWSCGKKQDLTVEAIEDIHFEEQITTINNYLEENKFQGSVLISQKGQVLFAKGFGLCDKKEPSSGNININTTFEIGSITKQMTAAAIMQQVEKKKLLLDDPISRFFPDYQYGDLITVRMLLNMRSGLTDCLNQPYEFFPKKIADKIENNTVKNKPVDKEIILKYLNDAPLFIDPDSSYFYCNTNYYLLAKILEIVSGQSYKDYMKEHIFIPCGMNNTNLDFQNTDTRGYDWKKRYYSIPEEFSTGYGDVNSSAVDLFRWNEAFVNGKVVSKKTFKKMIDTESYGFGVNVQNGEIFHGGVTCVFNSYSTYHPETKVSIVVLINRPQNESYAPTVARDLYKLCFTDQ